MKRQVLSLLLTLTLAAGLFPAAHAANSVEDLFPARQPYAGFSDVPAGSWYEPCVRLSYEMGLMLGTGGGFSPAGTVTEAEAAVIAARFSGILDGGDGVLPPAADGEAWFAPAARALAPLGIATPVAPEAPIARQAFFALFSAVVPEAFLPPINSISALPDTGDPAVLTLYNAGILTGVDALGTFAGEKTLSRAEAAATLCRLARPALRVLFSPADKDDIIWQLSGLPHSTVLFRSAESEIAAGDYFPLAVYYIDLLERDSRQQGIVFRWDNMYGDETFLSYVSRQAETAARRYAVTESRAARYGVSLTQDDQNTLDWQRAAAAEALGGEGAFARSLPYNALSEESYRRFNELELLYLNLGVFLHTPDDAVLSAFLKSAGTPGLDPEEGRRLYRENMMKTRLSQWTAETPFSPTPQGAAVDLSAFYERLKALRETLDNPA